MKAILIAATLMISQFAFADGACTALVNYVGTYTQTSKTCDDQFNFLGATLKVEPYTEPTYAGYWLISNLKGYGPTTSDGIGDVDKCTVNGDAVTVEIGGNDTSGSSLPAKGRLSYSFAGSTASFTADGCTATYSR
jgi:hypothetical protein